MSATCLYTLIGAFIGERELVCCLIRAVRCAYIILSVERMYFYACHVSVNSTVNDSLAVPAVHDHPRPPPFFFLFFFFAELLPPPPPPPPPPPTLARFPGVPSI